MPVISAPWLYMDLVSQRILFVDARAWNASKPQLFSMAWISSSMASSFSGAVLMPSMSPICAVSPALSEFAWLLLHLAVPRVAKTSATAASVFRGEEESGILKIWFVIKGLMLKHLLCFSQFFQNSGSFFIMDFLYFTLFFVYSVRDFIRADYVLSKIFTGERMVVGAGFCGAGDCVGDEFCFV